MVVFDTGALIALERNVREVVVLVAEARQTNATITVPAACLAQAGARVDEVFVCPHAEDACDCRKPRPGMLLAALRSFGLTPRDAVMVGDADSDIEAGRRAGVRTVQIVVPGASSEADAVAPDLATAVDALLAEPSMGGGE